MQDQAQRDNVISDVDHLADLQRGNTSRVAAGIGDQRPQHAAHGRIPAVQTPFALLSIRIDLSQLLSPSRTRADTRGTCECTPDM